MTRYTNGVHCQMSTLATESIASGRHGQPEDLLVDEPELPRG